jgi:histidine triad (HIT) family protein
MQNSCVFCKIIDRQLPATIIKETEDIIVIDNIAPKTPIHYLVIPKKHVKDINSLEKEDAELVGKMILITQELSSNLQESKDFRLVVNNGLDAGQSVFHLHFHFLAGQKFFDHA